MNEATIAGKAMRLVVLALALSCVCQSSHAAADLPRMRVGSVPSSTAPATADAYYPQTNTSTRELWGPSPSVGRPVEIKELARALRHNADLIYEYVHDNVRTVFMYGLQKGALGAMIDLSGTPFDQAHLMVELLRESGYSARYKVGALRLTSAQATAWMGLTNASAIEKIFRDGGVPISAGGGEFTIGHVWVEVTIPDSTCASSCWFDPSYKSHSFKSGLSATELEGLMGWSANELDAGNPAGFLGQAWSGIQQQPTPAAPVWVANVNHSNITTKLTGYATNLLAQLRSPAHRGKELEDVIGGQEIIRNGATSVRNSGTLPGFTTSVYRTWDCTGDSSCGIPDPFRTRLTLQLLDFTAPNTGPAQIAKSLFVDEIYGRRLMLEPTGALGAPGVSGFEESWTPYCVRLIVDATAAGQAGCTGGTTPEPALRGAYLRMEIDHPYASAEPTVGGAPAGTYMDRSFSLGTHIEKLVDVAMPVIIVHGWGDVSPALAAKLGAEQEYDRLTPRHVPYVEEPLVTVPASSMDHTHTKLAAAFLAQYSRMAQIQARLGNVEHALHHMVGVVYSEAIVNVDGDGNNPDVDHKWFLQDRGARANIDGSISINSRSDNATDRTKVIHATLGASAALEGSIYEQLLDVPESASTAARFHWGSANLGGMRFYLFTPAAPSGSGGSSYTFNGCAPGGGAALNPIGDYVNAAQGYWAITALDLCLGPGNKYGAQNGASYGPTLHRGSAFIAHKPDGSAVAHVLGYLNDSSKGGGAGVVPKYQQQFNPAGASDLLKDTFEDRSRLHGIDLKSGEFSYTAPVDIAVGEGGFPYELSLQRTFRPGGTPSPGLAKGWAHSLDVRAQISGDGLAAMGRDSALEAASTIVALYTAQQIFSISPAPANSPTAAQQRDHLKRWVLAPFVHQWWGTKLTYNKVTITRGGSAQEFTRLADGTFNPGRGGVGTLTQTGNRQFHQKPSAPTGEWDRWNYSGVSFTYTSPAKEVQTFGYYENVHETTPPGIEREYGRRHGWHLTSWTFPQGVTITFNYVTTDPVNAKRDRLSSVQNNLGRSLTFSYGLGTTTVSDGQGRNVQFQGASEWFGVLTQATNAEGQVTKYSYIGGDENPELIPVGARPQPYAKLFRVFAPSDPAYAKTELTFDRTWRVKEYRDAVAVKTPAQRGAWSFHITGGTRGERIDPAGGQYTAYYDARGRAIQLIDEEDRTVSQSFDNHDRVKERVFPEGNRIQFAYDDRVQQIERITQVAKSPSYYSTTLANLVVEATYDAACGKIKTVTDAKSKVTTWNYHPTTCTLTNVQQPSVPDPQNGNALTIPQTSYLYNGFGQITQVTDPTGRVVSFDYDPTTRYRWHQYANPGGLNLTTTYDHNAYGDINSVTTALGQQTTYQYDRQRRLTRIDGPAGTGAATINRLDADGDVYQVEKSTNLAKTAWQVWQRSFTPTKQLETETSPTNAVTTYAYDALDRVFVVQDPDGRRVKTEYFADGHAKKIIKAHQSATMAPIQYVNYTRTPNGQIDTIIDGNGNVTNLDYDGHERLVRTFFPDPNTGLPCTPGLPHSAAAPSCGANQTYEQLGYDANGNVISKRNRSGSTIAFVFDDLNREATRTIPANAQGRFGRSLGTSYDLASRKWDLSVAESPLASQTIAHRYDVVGRMDYVTDTYLGAANVIDYDYDARGNRTLLGYPGGGSVSYSYDALNRMDTVVEGGITLADYDWDPLSRRDLASFNNSAFSLDLGYEADDDLGSLVHTGPAPLSFSFLRNNSGQIKTLTASDDAFLARPATNKTDTYIPNRLNQISSISASSGGAVTLTYDLNGNLTGDGTYVYEYDEENRLRSVAQASTPTSAFATYEYDPLGRRRAKTVNGTKTIYVSDGAEEIEERTASNVVLRKYVYGSGIDDRIAMLDSSACASGRCYYLTNWQGSTTTLVNQNNTLNAVYHYGPYGEGVNWTPSDALTGNPFRYTGRRVDPETGLYYYRARYYSPKLGRFLQTDPIGTKDDLNLSAYVSNDPVNLVDRTGEGAVLNLFNQNPAAYTTEPSWIKSEQSLYATTQQINPRQVNVLAGHGDPRGVSDNRESMFQRRTADSDWLARQLMGQSGYNRQQPIILAACNLHNTLIPAGLALATKNRVFSGNGYVWGSRTAQGVTYTVSSSRTESLQDGTFAEYSASGASTGRTFSSISIAADGTVTLKGSEQVTGSRISREFTVTCTEKGKCN